MALRSNNSVLTVKQNNHKTNIANAYIVYDLDAWPKIPLNNFQFKNCLFGATNIVKDSYKESKVYSGYGIIFDGGRFLEFW